MVTRRTSHIALLIGVLSFFGAPALSETWYVDAEVSSSGKGISWKTALKTIQEGIDAAKDRDMVLVAEGTYLETIEFKGKNITLTSTAPLNPLVVDRTIIDGKGAGSVVTFSGKEDKGCVLSGFTIRDGKAQYGGGIAGHGALAVIRNNNITGNSADEGGGLYQCNGTIQNNEITANFAADDGGGLSSCDGAIRNNVIDGNEAHGTYPTGNGGGLYVCDGTIQDNTISRNTADTGGGLYVCDGTIQNNTISDNSADRGGGLSGCSGTIENNNIADNSARLGGGGLGGCGGTIQNNVITGNSTLHHGGGLSHCDGTIRNNDIMRNSTGGYGGGLNGCHAVIEKNDITGNSAESNGGGLYECNDVVRNNLIVGNMAATEGGGLYGCDASLESNTIAYNQAGEKGGGVALCDGLIINCIVWANTAPNGAQLYQSSVPYYSCIQDWADGGTGNINRDPQFVDPWGPDGLPETYEDNDYRLEPWSPCIDAGTRQTWMEQAVDLDGNPRIFDGGSSLRVDMGAYEYVLFAFRVTQFLREAGGQWHLTWNSRAGDTYVIWSRAHLSLGAWVEEATAPSQGASTSWTDVGLFGGQKFYRIELK